MDKLVFVKELSASTTKGGKSYPVVIDQENERWNIFQEGVNLQIHRAYLFTYDLNDKGFKDIKAIKPLTNVFKERALKEVASRNEIVRNLMMCLSYSKDLVIGGKLNLTDLYKTADTMYQWINNAADGLMPKEDDNAS